jgi:hypothetical protein
MKKIFFFLVLFSGISFAQANSNALGLFLHNEANNWGVDFKHLDSDKNAWNIYLSDLRFGDVSAVGLGFGYYFLYNVIKADASAGRFPLYWGPNVGFGYWSGGGGGPGSFSGLDVGVNLVGGVSWFTPTSFKMDFSIELLSPSLGHWHQSVKQPEGNWKTNSNPAFGLKGNLGFRILFHAYLF